jgi:hypothetical protein
MATVSPFPTKGGRFGLRGASYPEPAWRAAGPPAAEGRARREAAMKPMPGTRIAVLRAGLLLALAPTAHSQSFPPEVQVGASTIIDYEFDWGRDGTHCTACNFGDGNNRLSFIDTDGNLWIGHVDVDSGDFIPGDGQGERVDTGAIPAQITFNGPEWMGLQNASALVYDRYADGKPHTTSNMCAGFARVLAAGSWDGGCMPKTRGTIFPGGTEIVGDRTPMVSYQNYSTTITNIYWRPVRQGAQAYAVLTGSTQSQVSRRWIPGTHQLLLTAQPPDGPAHAARQVFRYSTSDRTLEQLTFDTANKTSAFMWRAPEYDDDFVFFTRVGQSEIDIYRYLPDGSGSSSWQIVNRIRSTPDMPYIFSPETFVYNGKSWIFFAISPEPEGQNDEATSQIAISGIEADMPTFRVLTSDIPDARSRRDPEYFITANGPYIYYNRYIPVESGPNLSEGVFRVDAGLGPALRLRPRAGKNRGGDAGNGP